MPEVIVERIDVREVQGVVTIVGRGGYGVSVAINESGRSAQVTADAPEGVVLEASIGGPLSTMTATAILDAGVRGALLEEE